MPWMIRCTSDGAEVLYSGRTTGSDILSAKRAFFTHGFERPPRYLLCDFGGVEQFDVDQKDVQAIIDQDLAAVSTHPHVLEVVVAPTPLQYGLARMWQMKVEQFRPQTCVARSRPEAVSWLESQGAPLAPRVEGAHST
jgi:hypothetical protein